MPKFKLVILLVRVYAEKTIFPNLSSSLNKSTLGSLPVSIAAGYTKSI